MGRILPDGTPSFVGGCHYNTAGPNRFSYTWSASTQTLKLTYTANPNAGQRVAAQGRIKPSVGSALDMQFQFRNDWGHALDQILFPGDPVFGEAESREAAIAGTPGALDTAFDPGTGANDTVFAVAQQPDGKVLVGGQFTQFNGAARHRIARLEADGSLSGAYNPSVTGAGFAGVVSLALQSDGKTVIGGLFSQVNGVACANIAHLKADGSLDPAFNPGTGVTGTDAYLNTVTLPSAGKALIGGVFTRYNDTSRNNATGDTIIFAPTLSGRIITLTLGQLNISKGLTIDGSGLTEHVKISGNSTFRVFATYSNDMVTLRDLDIIAGTVSDGNGGSGLYNQRDLTVIGCAISGNTTPNNGGGIRNTGTLIMNDSIVSANTAG